MLEARSLGAIETLCLMKEAAVQEENIESEKIKDQSIFICGLFYQISLGSKPLKAETRLVCHDFSEEVGAQTMCH